MPKGLTFALPAIMFVGLMGFFLAGLFLDPSYIPSPFINKPAPSFDLPKLLVDDERITLQDMRGNYSLVNVWATWCSIAAQDECWPT